MSIKANTPLSFDEFAKSVGKFGKDLQSSAKPLADAYAKATPEQQADLKARWMLNHLIGQGIKNAEAVIKTGKSKQASREHIKAIDRAYSDFAYNIKQSKKTKPLPASSGRQVKVVAPRKVLDAVVAEVVNSGMTKAEFNALIAALREQVIFE
jgi:sugar-specific transcriptional regulator TrmB